MSIPQVVRALAALAITSPLFGVAAQTCTTNIGLLPGANVQYNAILWNGMPALSVLILDSDPLTPFISFWDPALGNCPRTLRLQAVGALDTRECAKGRSLYLAADWEGWWWQVATMPEIPGAVGSFHRKSNIGWIPGTGLMRLDWSFNYVGPFWPGPCPFPPLGPEIVVAVFTFAD